MKGILNLDDLNISNYEDVINSNKGFLKINNQSYFYKRCKLDLAYREIIAYEISSFLNIPSVFYQPILIPKPNYEIELGVMSEDFRKDNTDFIKAYFLLKDFYNDYLKEWGYNDRENNYNNLESIWKALEYRYKFFENKNIIIEDLFNKIINNIFLFDIFISNADRHFHNWGLSESIDVIDLNKNYDNEDMFLGNYSIPELCVSKSTNRYDFYDTLQEFLKITDNKYLNNVKKMYYTLTSFTIIKILEITEKRHNIIIPVCLKQEIVSKYNAHYTNIGKVLNEFIEKENKKILHK